MPDTYGASEDKADTPKMTRESLRTLIQGEYSAAMSGYASSELQKERATALNYYNGDMKADMPSLDGRSSAVSMDVLEAVEGLMPDLMEVFFGADDVVEFQAVGPEDEDAAQQETDYTNHVFKQKNPGFIILYSFIKDALLSKVGVNKTFWEKTKKDRRETYYDQSEDVFMMVAKDEEIELVAKTEKPDPLNPGGPPLYDFTVSVKEEVGQARVVPVPPEEFGISKSAKSIKDANYAFHRVKTRTAGDLKAEGYDPKQIDSLTTSIGIEGVEESARDTVEMGKWSSSTDNNQRVVTVTEHYIRCDYDGRGTSCLWRVTTGGNTGEILRRLPDDTDDMDSPEVKELEKPDADDTTDEGYVYAIDEVDEMPFAAITPIIMTHRFWGKSIADMVLDIQRQKTALKRQLLDNIYLANNARTYISETLTNDRTIDDLLDNRPGGIVRGKAPGGIEQLQTQSIGQFVFPMLEYVDQEREFRSGVSKAGQGLDPNTLQNQSATASNQMFTAAKAKTRLIARIFAETGVRDMFLLLHSTIRKNDRQDNTVKLRNQWVTLNPRDWRERNDMTVNVGLGTGSKEQQINQLMVVIQQQTAATAAGMTNLVTPQNLYNSAKRLVELVGLRSVEPYFTDPTTAAPQDPKPDPEMMKAQMQMQIAQQTSQSQQQLDMQKFQAQSALDQQQAQHRNQLEMVQANADIAVQNKKAESEMAMAQQRAAFDFQLKQQEHELNLRHMAMQAQMQNDLAIEAAKTKNEAVKSQASKAPPNAK